MKFIEKYEEYLNESREEAKSEEGIKFLYMVKEKNPDELQRIRNLVVNKGLTAAKREYFSSVDSTANLEVMLSRNIKKGYFEYLDDDSKKRALFYIKKLKESKFKDQIRKYFKSFWNSGQFKVEEYKKAKYKDLVMDSIWTISDKKDNPTNKEVQIFLERMTFRYSSRQLKEPNIISKVIVEKSLVNKKEKYLIYMTGPDPNFVFRNYNEKEIELFAEIRSELTDKYERATDPRGEYNYRTWKQIEKIIAEMFSKIDSTYMQKEVDKILKKNPQYAVEYENIMSDEQKKKWRHLFVSKDMGLFDLATS